MHARFPHPFRKRALGRCALALLPLLASCAQSGVDPNSVDLPAEGTAEPASTYQRSQAPAPAPQCATCQPTLPVIDRHGHVLSDHPHQVLLSARQQLDGLPCVLLVLGSDHSHSLPLDSEQIRRIAAGGKVIVRTDGAQYHVVVFGG